MTENNSGEYVSRRDFIKAAGAWLGGMLAAPYLPYLSSAEDSGVQEGEATDTYVPFINLEHLQVLSSSTGTRTHEVAMVSDGKREYVFADLFNLHDYPQLRHVLLAGGFKAEDFDLAIRTNFYVPQYQFAFPTAEAEAQAAALLIQHPELKFDPGRFSAGLHQKSVPYRETMIVNGKDTNRTVVLSRIGGTFHAQVINYNPEYAWHSSDFAAAGVIRTEFRTDRSDYKWSGLYAVSEKELTLIPGSGRETVPPEDGPHTFEIALFESRDSDVRSVSGGGVILLIRELGSLYAFTWDMERESFNIPVPIQLDESFILADIPLPLFLFGKYLGVVGYGNQPIEIAAGKIPGGPGVSLSFYDIQTGRKAASFPIGGYVWESIAQQNSWINLMFLKGDKVQDLPVTQTLKDLTLTYPSANFYWYDQHDQLQITGVLVDKDGELLFEEIPQAPLPEYPVPDLQVITI